MKTILITGINGFLGSNLYEKFKDDFEIFGLDTYRKEISIINEENFYLLSDSLPNLIFNRKIDIILHCLTVYSSSDNSSYEITKNNIMYSQMLFEKAISNGVAVFINIDTVLHELTNDYSLSKSYFKKWLKIKCESSTNTKVINLKLDYLYGLGASSKSFVNVMIDKMINNDEEIYLTKGNQKRNFLNIKDLMNAFELMFDRLDKFEKYTTISICSDKNTSIKSLLNIIKALTGSKSSLCFGKIPYRRFELMNSDIVNDNEILGFKPRIQLEDGLREIIELKKENL